MTWKFWGWLSEPLVFIGILSLGIAIAIGWGCYQHTARLEAEKQVDRAYIDGWNQAVKIASMVQHASVNAWVKGKSHLIVLDSSMAADQYIIEHWVDRICDLH